MPNTLEKPVITPFSLARLPRIEFGPGSSSKLPTLIRSYGKNALLVTGAHSFTSSAHWPVLQAALINEGVQWKHIEAHGEPSPAFVDDIVRAMRGAGFDCVVGIGGGSALDTAKAIAGLLVPGNSVIDHLEGVGPERPYLGPTTPFISVPTTAGTGSEATKNAVLSLHGAHGYKKSFRDDKLVAEWAIVDPDLLASCPHGIIAANGMDALTQLLESYVSTRANTFTDTLALSGLEAVRDGLLPWFEGAADAPECRSRMAYAALLSGITLAQVGLGSVHGLAAPLGAFFPIPHGMACGTLVAQATRVNIDALRMRGRGHPALGRYADVGRLLSGMSLADDLAHAALLETLEDWTRRMRFPLLRDYGITEADIDRIIASSRGSSMKTNPVVLDDAEIAAIVRARL